MTALDPITSASPVYRDAVRHPFKTGDAFEVLPARRAARAILPSLFAYGSLLVLVLLALAVIGGVRS